MEKLKELSLKLNLNYIGENYMELLEKCLMKLKNLEILELGLNSCDLASNSENFIYIK